MRRCKTSNDDLPIGGALGITRDSGLRSRMGFQTTPITTVNLRPPVPQPIGPPSSPIPKTDSVPNEKKFIYFVEEEVTGRIKIGVTKNIKDRLRQMQAHTSSDLKLLVQVEVPDAFKIERRLHVTFRDLRIKGEWFSPEIIWFPEALIKIEGYRECPLCTYDVIASTMDFNRDECTMLLLRHIISSIPGGQHCEKHSIIEP